MPATKAEQAAVNRYRKKAYDTIQITVPKGQRDIIKAHAEQHGESLSALIKRAIANQIARDNNDTTT